MSQSNKKRSRKQKYIRVPVTEEEDCIINEKSAEMKLSKGSYCHLKITEETIGMEEYGCRIMQMMPDFYEHVRKLENAEIRTYFMQFGGKLCRYLK